MLQEVVAKINRLKNWQAFLIIFIVGISTYYTGLFSPFRDDDYVQIVNSVPVHSISNIRLFFEGGTFYYGHGLTPMSGVYYRPLMTTMFSVIYTLFGPHTFYFHLVQLLLGIGSALLLYLIFNYFFISLLSLLLSLVFLVHPLDSQVLFAIPSMQDALFLFFGILGMYLLLKYKSNRTLVPVIFCIFLSLLSKETAILFVLMAVIYLFYWDRKRLKYFTLELIPFVVFWLILRWNAVGLDSNPHNAPIDYANIYSRLMTDPSAILLYFSKFIFPLKLSSGYYFVDKNFSFEHVLVPLIIDLLIVVSLIVMGYKIKANSAKADYFTYLFFCIWLLSGIVAHMQITPLDFTASEPWFYFSMVGLLGIIGIAIKTFNIKSEYVLLAGVLLVCILSARTISRGNDWENNYRLAKADISASPSDYVAYVDASTYFSNNNEYGASVDYLHKSIDIFPTYFAYYDLGIDYSHLGKYQAADIAYQNSVNLNPPSYVYENLVLTTLLSNNLVYDTNVFQEAIKKYPNDPTIWLYASLLFQKLGNHDKAVESIEIASKYGQIPPNFYNDILQNLPIKFNYLGTGNIIYIKSTP